ncbi:hypothetical protein Tco_1245782 [Tanacetum coccineum]
MPPPLPSTISTTITTTDATPTPSSNRHHIITTTARTPPPPYHTTSIASKGAFGLTVTTIRGHMRGVHIHYCPGVLGGDTCEGYIFITARVLLEGKPAIGTYGFHYCPDVLGGDTYDGLKLLKELITSSASSLSSWLSST